VVGPIQELRVVIVDDDRDTVNTLVWLLQTAGHEVVGCYAGWDAIDEACARRAEVVIIDLAMPGLDGNEVARRLRRQDACKDALLIAVTGYSDDEHRKLAREAGFDHYFVKPVHFATLSELLEARKSETKRRQLPSDSPEVAAGPEKARRRRWWWPFGRAT
jgi:DNA-binding response OmpR family regulator